MKYLKIKSFFPGFCHSLLDPFFESELPKERLASCNNCYMTKKRHEQFKDVYNPKIKCCTYNPDLPNYLVGAILTNTNPKNKDGIQKILGKIRARTGVSPHGLSPSKKQQLMQDVGKRCFGKAKSLLCSYYKNGRCSVWPYNGSVCRTFFCVSCKGFDGALFWDALREYISYIEDVLRIYSQYSLNMDIENIIRVNVNSRENLYALSVEDIDEEIDEKQYKKLWDKFMGKERDFYIRCYRVVNELSKKQFDEIKGIREKILLERVKHYYREMMFPCLPKVLKLNSDYLVTRTSAGQYIMQRPSLNLTFRLSEDLFNAVLLFNGKETNEKIIKKIEQKLKIFLKQDLLISLWHNKILITGNS
jgi:hypothetical protein